MENKTDLSNVKFELEEQPITNDKPKDTPPVIDFFNSAGNTKLSEEITEQPTEEITTDPTKPKGKIVLGKLISGKSAVTLVNIFIPSFIVFAMNKFGYSASKGQLKLTNEEKEILNPVVQDCLDYVEINFDNPFYALGFVAAMIYGSKIFDIVPDLKKIKADIVEDKEEIEKPIKPFGKDWRPDFSNREPIKEQTVRNESPLMDNTRYREIREKHDSTTIRNDKKKIVISAIEEAAPKDIIEAFAIYGAIFPQRDENYFRKWYYDNIELMPPSLRWDETNNAIEESKEFDL